MAEIELEIEKIGAMLMQATGSRISVDCSSGDTLKLTVGSEHIMALVEYLLLTSYSLGKSTGEIAALEVVDVQTHLFEEGMVGVEAAFGSNDAVTWLALRLPAAKKLHKELGRRIQQITPPPGATN